MFTFTHTYKIETDVVSFIYLFLWPGRKIARAQYTARPQKKEPTETAIISC